MKKVFIATLAVAVAALVVSCSKADKVCWGYFTSQDSLSYCLGANIGIGVNGELGDIPFDFDKVTKGIKDGALKPDKYLQDSAIVILRNYFMNTLQSRRQQNAAMDADTTVAEKHYVELLNEGGECDSVSYAFGNDIGHNVAASKLPVRIKHLINGFNDGRTIEGDSAIQAKQMEIQIYLQHYFMEVRPAQAAERSTKWLAKMSKKSGVKTTESGLAYKIVKEGDMTKTAVDDRDVVKVNYEGKLQDGTIFDSSYERNEPAEFPLNRVIKGWTEGMKLVGEGGEIILYIPAELAYGNRGAGREIGPNEALEFKVELLEVKPFVEETPAEGETAEPKAEENK